MMLLVFFFFQAEDGIRDWSVTGVQTCALPISPVEVAQQGRDRRGQRAAIAARWPRRSLPCCATSTGVPSRSTCRWTCARSEERRVGKECRYQWALDDGKNRCGRMRHSEVTNNE